MSASPQALQPQSSFDVATTLMTPAQVNQKFEGHDLPTFTEAQKEAGRHEVAMGFDAASLKDMALETFQGGLPIPGGQVAAVTLGVPFMFWARDNLAQRAMQQLAENYREEIAADLRIQPELVTEEVVLRYATQNENLASAVRAIAHERESHIANTSTAVGGMLAGGAAGGAIGGIPGLIAGFGLGMFGYNVGEMIGKRFTDSTDGKSPIKLIEAMQGKLEEKQMISAMDVFTLRVAQSKPLQEAIEARHGDAFHLLDEMTQREVVSKEAGLYQQCIKDAACCNLPDANPQQMLLGQMDAPQLANANYAPAANFNAPPAYANQPTGWVSRVMDERAGQQMQQPREIGFAEAVLRGRDDIAVGPKAEQAL